MVHLGVFSSVHHELQRPKNFNKPGWKASFGWCCGGSNTETVGVEIVGRETTALKNCPKLCCEIVPFKPLSGLDNGEQRVARWWLGLKEIVFYGHHQTDR